MTYSSSDYFAIPVNSATRKRARGDCPPERGATTSACGLSAESHSGVSGEPLCSSCSRIQSVAARALLDPGSTLERKTTGRGRQAVGANTSTHTRHGERKPTPGRATDSWGAEDARSRRLRANGSRFFGAFRVRYPRTGRRS